ncbi:MAG: ribokinase [Candidatus Hydrogenedentes bacterium]|nr:ribokinase [Candidatus Hydrogenedentota bacterium]
MPQPRILVVGSANIDLVTQVPRIPKPGETVIGTSFYTVCGGKGANQAVAAARLGAHAYFAGCVGNDAFGALQRQSLGDEGIDLTHLITHPTEATGTAVILVADQGQNSIVVTPSANYGFTPDRVEAMAPLIAQMDAVLVQLEIPFDSVAATLRIARSAGVLGVLDAGPAQRVPEGILELADIVSPNETEAEAMTGVKVASLDDARLAAAKLLEMGGREVVLKLGANGALYANTRESFHVPPFPVDAVDAVAAGDAFTAALAIAWRWGVPNDAIRFANATGALATLTPGAQPSLPKRTAVEAFLRERNALPTRLAE